jgi:hypothetical protein
MRDDDRAVALRVEKAYGAVSAHASRKPQRLDQDLRANRQSKADLDLVRAACSLACSKSAEECERHAAHHEHCRLCADVCRRCKRACDALIAAIG